MYMRTISCCIQYVYEDYILLYPVSSAGSALGTSSWGPKISFNSADLQPEYQGGGWRGAEYGKRKEMPNIVNTFRELALVTHLKNL